ncbi:DUF2254 domain-containing protein [Stenotrophomonas sp. JAI102]|uniref:DUF2254 domain-containing protein n=1 Tax=Stenotrophomonas sp. JAI102 TaxID=2723077 RepID=UPI0017A4DA67|nr:DUF2254 domain-containing protein [Stenotrophomonas sp. JAI102]NYF34758.1 putative membrane protein [Stenotrophomonas sp. JAI102]
MWFRSTLYGVLGVATALAGAGAKLVLPEGLAAQIGADSVGNILGILAASMLTVTTFALSTMVAAYGSASTNATPRASRLLIEDTRAQGTLATFIGAFLFSIVGLIALSTGIYGDSGRLVLFGATITVIIVITVTLLRAIEQFSRFGRLGETVDLVEQATLKSMKQRAEEPFLGATPYSGVAPSNAIEVFAADVGHVEYIDVQRLNAVAEQHHLIVHVTCQPGTFATPNRALLSVRGTLHDEQRTQLLAAFTIGGARRIENDPRYGLVVLAEIGVRALSPAVNDPGTCITVIGTCVRLLLKWDALSSGCKSKDVQYPFVHMAQLDVDDLFEDVFAPISTDAVGSLEVNIKLQKAYAALSAGCTSNTRQVARRYANLSLERALQTLRFSQDRDKLRTIATVEHQRAQRASSLRP